MSVYRLHICLLKVAVLQMCGVLIEFYSYCLDDTKCQLEREVAKSLLSLSKMSHQTVSEQYANAGLVPLNARPNTYPYNFSANETYLSSKPHTPTLMLISEQKERETVICAFVINY